MKLVWKNRSSKEIENCDWRSAVQVEIDGKRVFNVWDGEPEDSNLGRDFNDVYRLPEVFRMIHEAGLRGESLDIETVEDDEV